MVVAFGLPPGHKNALNDLLVRLRTAAWSMDANPRTTGGVIGAFKLIRLGVDVTGYETSKGVFLVISAANLSIETIKEYEKILKQLNKEWTRLKDQAATDAITVERLIR